MGALEEVVDLAEAVAARRSLHVWDVQVGGGPGRTMVRVFVDGDDGVDVDTVAEVSEEISRGLDLRDPIPGRYTLEVSTPGLERTLKHPDHFARSIGARVVVKTTRPVVGNSHRLEGTIVATDGGTVTVEAKEQRVQVPFDSIKSARTVFEWS